MSFNPISIVESCMYTQSSLQASVPSLNYILLCQHPRFLEFGSSMPLQMCASCYMYQSHWGRLKSAQLDLTLHEHFRLA